MYKEGIKKLLTTFGIVALIIAAIVFWGKSSWDRSPGKQQVIAVPMDTSNMKQVLYSDLTYPADGRFQKAASSSSLELYYRETDGTVMVKDLRNRHFWISSVDKEKYGISPNLNEMWKYKLSSMLNIKYFDSLRNEGVPVETNAIKEKAFIKIKKIYDGICIRYVFESIQLEIQMEVLLKDDGITVRVPFGGIKENGTLKLTSIEILPVFGAAGAQDDGYVFYPDGSGAISSFNTNRSKTAVAQYRWVVYGNDVIDMEQETKEAQRGIKTAMLPVFGIKNGQNAFVAVISEGAADSIINYIPSGVAVNINRIFPEVVYRRTIDMSELGSNGGNKQTNEKITMFEEKIQKKDVTVDYFFLYGQDADYSGMANKCRAYFEGNGWIRKSLETDGEMPLAVNLFMGISEKRAIWDKYISVTSFSQANEILEKIYGIFDGKLILSLTGWARGGYDRYPTLPEADERLGGSKGLKRLSSQIKVNRGDIYLNVNLMDYDKHNGGFSLTKDVLYYGNTLPVTEKTKNYYLLNAARMFDKHMEKYQKLAVEEQVGLGLEKYGSSLFVDFNDSMTREGLADRIAMGISELNEKRIKVAGEGNLFMLGNASYLVNIPQSDSMYELTDEAVPFYQMVVHGFIPYTSEPGNLAFDYQWQKLKWIEYGSIPYYVLTYLPSENLKYTAYNHLFSSNYLNWLDTIAETAREYKENMTNLWKYKIVRHEMLQKGIYRISYENGQKVYINYTSQPVKAGQLTIESMNYRVCN